MKRRINSFKDLIVWQKSILLFKEACDEVEKFPNKRAAWIIEEQLLDALGSISANIAEGFGRKGKGEFAYHLGVAKGSAAESHDWYEKIRLLGFLDEETINKRIMVLEEIQKMLNTLISKVLNS